jgi:hypothetical protein
MLRVRVAARVIVPVGVVWGVYDWFWIHPVCAIIYGLLTFNYVLALFFVVTRSPQINGPLRIRPIQTFILLINAFVLPIVYYRTYGVVPWFFILVCLLMAAGLYAGVVTHIYFMQKLPMAPLFQKQHANKEAPAEPVPVP